MLDIGVQRKEKHQQKTLFTYIGDINHPILSIVFVNMSKNNHFIGLNDDAPPAKRLKLELDRAETRDLNNNIESDESQEFGLPSSEFDVRKRKIAVKRPAEKTVLDLHSYAVLEIFEYLPLNG